MSGEAPESAGGLQPGATEISLSFPEGDGNLPAERRAEILTELRRMPWRRVWLNEAVWINTGAIGGPTLDLAVMVEGTLSGVAVVAVTALAKSIFQIAKGRFLSRRLRFISEDRPEVEYVVGHDPDADASLGAALDAVPADYEVSEHTTKTVRIWRDGRWEIVEIRRVTGGPSN